MNGSDWEVGQFDFKASAWYGAWYVTRRGEPFTHLHIDGQVWKGTLNPETNARTGYFLSRESAEAAIKKWEKENMAMIELGKHYRTRDGKYRTDNDTLRVLMVDGGGCQQVVFAMLRKGKWEIEQANEIGRYRLRPEFESEWDLIEIKPRRKVVFWVNIYGDDDTPRLFHATEASAHLHASSGRKACVRVEFEYEEGEGL